MKTKQKQPIKKTLPKQSEVFEFKIDSFLPIRGREIKKDIKDAIIKYLLLLNTGESFFISNKHLNSSTVRKVVLKEIQDNKKFKNLDIRVMLSKENEIKGCRVARFL
jgi:hypothetical protein